MRLASVLLLLGVGACSRGPSGLHLDEVLPSLGCPQQRIDLVGGGFGDGAYPSYVTFGGQAQVFAWGLETGAPGPDTARSADGGTPAYAGKVLSWQDNHIALLLPSLKPGLTDVVVTVSAGVSNPQPLQVGVACGRPDGGRGG